MFDRDEVTKILVDDDLNSGDGYLFEMLAGGFKGYDNMTDDQLIGECEERGLSYLLEEVK